MLPQFAVAKTPALRREDKRAQLAFNPVALAVALGMTLVGITIVHPASVINFAYYLLLWNAYIFALHRKEIGEFLFAFLVNSAFIAIFYIIQTSVFPESFGTTSPLGSQTDDSYFFALAADSIPLSMELRDYYYLYSETYSSLMRAVSILPINHPMDLIFFQSGVAALLSTFSRRFALQETGDVRVANATYYLTMFCPFLMLNGGVILVRDTLAASLFVYSLACINDRMWVRTLIANGLQFAIRPGTALILIPAYFVLNLSGLRKLSGRTAVLTVGLPLAFALTIFVVSQIIDLSVYQSRFSQVSLTGREVIEAFRSDVSANRIFLWVQEQPFWLKLPLNGAYIFLYPFISINSAFPNQLFDVRSVGLNLAYPLMAFWFNSWFVAGAITRAPAGRRHRAIVWMFIVTTLLIGTYSLQTRHKTIIQPIYYIIAAVGVVRGAPRDKRIGYLVGGGLLAIQIVMTVR